MVGHKRGQPPPLSARASPHSPPPLAIKDARSPQAVKPKMKRICFDHDPANNRHCPNGAGCPHEHLYTNTAEGSETFTKVKGILDMKHPVGSSPKGRGKHQL